MSNSIILDYLEQNIGFISKGTSGQSALSAHAFNPELISKLITGLLLDIEKVDISLLRICCHSLRTDLESFFLSESAEDRGLLAKETISRLHLQLVSAETAFLTPTSDNSSCKAGCSSLSKETVRNFTEAIPELSSHEYVYSLCRFIDSWDGDISYFHPLFSHAEYATKESTFYALMTGCKIEASNAQLISSSSLISKFGLDDHLALAVWHNLKKPDILASLAGESFRFMDGINYKGSFRGLQSVFALTKPAHVIDYDDAKSGVHAIIEADSCISNLVLDCLEKIRGAHWTEDAIFTNALGTLQGVSQAISTVNSRDPKDAFGYFISYAVSVTAIMEGVVKRFDTDICNLLKGHNMLLPPSAFLLQQFGHFFKMANSFLLPKDGVDTIKSALMSMDDSFFSNISDAVCRLCNERMTFIDPKDILNGVIQPYMPSSFKVDILKRGVPLEFVSSVIGDTSPIELCAYPNLDSALDSAIDYLSVIKLKYPSFKPSEAEFLNFSVNHVRPRGLSDDHLSNFNDVFVSRLQKRIANDAVAAHHHDNKEETAKLKI